MIHGPTLIQGLSLLCNSACMGASICKPRLIAACLNYVHDLISIQGAIWQSGLFLKDYPLNRPYQPKTITQEMCKTNKKKRRGRGDSFIQLGWNRMLSIDCLSRSQQGLIDWLSGSYNGFCSDLLIPDYSHGHRLLNRLSTGTSVTTVGLGGLVRLLITPLWVGSPGAKKVLHVG